MWGGFSAVYSLWAAVAWLPSFSALWDQQLAVPLQSLLGIPRARRWDKGSQKGKQRSGLQGLSGTHFIPHEASYHSRPAAIIESQYWLVHMSYSHSCGRTCRLTLYNTYKEAATAQQATKSKFLYCVTLIKNFSYFCSTFFLQSLKQYPVRHRLFLLTCIHPEYLFYNPLSSDLPLSF